MKDSYPGVRYFPTVHNKKRVKLENSVKEIIDRRAKGGIATFKRKLELEIRGWSNYFHGAVPDSWMKETDRGSECVSDKFSGNGGRSRAIRLEEFR